MACCIGPPETPGTASRLCCTYIVRTIHHVPITHDGAMKKRQAPAAPADPGARGQNKKLVTIRIDAPTIEYFRELSAETGIRYQTLINLYLRDCAMHRRRLSMTWRTGPDGNRQA
jgi:uncharacterized protein (DUF4415 family)